MHTDRTSLLRRAIWLEYLTVLWNILEGIITVTVGARADSVALVGFGVDSFIEMASGLVLLWRLRHELNDGEAVDAIEKRAHRAIGVLFILLALYLSFTAVDDLHHNVKPLFSPTGTTIAAVSIVCMLFFARAKNRIADALDSHALHADALQSTVCWQLSVITIVGSGLNALFGWWWADPVAGLGMVVFLAREGRHAICGRGHTH